MRPTANGYASQPFVQFRDPQIRERLTTHAPPQTTEEPADVTPDHQRVMLTLTPIGQRPQPVQTVSRAVAANLAPRPPLRLRSPDPAPPAPTPAWVGPIPPRKHPPASPASGYSDRNQPDDTDASKREQQLRTLGAQMSVYVTSGYGARSFCTSPGASMADEGPTHGTASWADLSTTQEEQHRCNSARTP